MSLLVKSILIGLVAVLGNFDYQLGTLYCFRPIVLSPIVGLICGDLQAGITIGASLEMFFMGAISVGAYIPPDVIVGGVLATAFAITMGKGMETALALSMPIALISLAISNLISAILPAITKYADNSAERGEVGGIKRIHWLYGLVVVVEQFLLVFGAFYAGVDAVQSFMNWIPKVVTDGMGVAASILPTLGFAMLMRMILNKQLLPFYFLGFVLTAYLKMPVLGVTIIAIVISIEKLGFLDKKVVSDSTGMEGKDDDF